jgi:predicted DNA-binding transcriptional regulator AlpA
MSKTKRHAADDDFVDVKTACAILGGTKPWHVSTLWRALRDPNRGLPKPVQTGPNSIRFLRKELLAAKAAMIAARDNPVAQAEIAKRNRRINDTRVKARAERGAHHDHVGERRRDLGGGHHRDLGGEHRHYSEHHGEEST